MIAGNTVRVTVSSLPVPHAALTELLVIYRSEESGQPLLTKGLGDMTVSNEEYTFTLTQAESLSLSGRCLRSVVFVTRNGIRAESLPELLEFRESAHPEVIE